MARSLRDIAAELAFELSLLEEEFDGDADAAGDAVDFNPGPDNGGQFHSAVARCLVLGGTENDTVTIELEHSDDDSTGFEAIEDRNGDEFTTTLTADEGGEAAGRIDLTNAEIKRYVRAVATDDSTLDTNADVIVDIIKGGATNPPVND